MVLDRLRKVPMRPICVPEIPVRLALPRPVPHLLCDRQVLRFVLDRLRKVTKRLIRTSDVKQERKEGVRNQDA